LAVYLSSIVGSASIGVYSLANEKIAIIPKAVPTEKAKQIADWLHVDLIHTSIASSMLAGAFVAANSNGIILPISICEEELATIQACFKGNVTILETKKTAYGNLISANDFGAVVDPRLRDPVLKQISDTLGVEVVKTEIAGLPYVGSLAVATNKGVLAHPLLKDSERRILEKTLKVPVDVGTVNCGIPYVGTGLIANSHAAVAGSMTTGPEMFIIGNALDVVQDDV
jgi:translation initiation factor 6